MNKSLQISKTLSLPLDTVTDTIGVLAIKGAGKTYTFMVIAEEMAKRDLPFVILDPVGVCWGLRASADGKGAGLKVIIVGGAHGDIPLDEGSGTALADWVLEERRPAVFDLSGLPTKAATIRFALDFLSRLYQAANRNPIHVILDEADEFAPQKPFGEETRLLRAVEVLVRRGRAKGLGVTMVTQRPAVLSKNVLTQIGTLVVGAIRSPQDRKAVTEWVDAHATKEQRDAFLKSLASMPNTKKWIWSPGRDIFSLVEIRKRETFDSSSTPKVGELTVKPRQLAPVDLKALTKRIEESLEKSRSDDPKALRARIRELESAQPKTEVVYRVPPFVVERLQDVLSQVKTLKEDTDRMLKHAKLAMEHVGTHVEGPVEYEVATVREPKRRKEHVPADMKIKSVPLKSGAIRMLNILATFNPEPLTRHRLATLAGMSPKSGTFLTYLGHLKRAGLVVDEGKKLGITEDGWRGCLDADGNPPPKPKAEDVFNMWKSKFKAGAVRMLEALRKEKSGVMTRIELAYEVGMEPSSGTFLTYLGHLRRNGLVVTKGSQVQIDETLYLGAK